MSRKCFPHTLQWVGFWELIPYSSVPFVVVTFLYAFFAVGRQAAHERSQRHELVDV